MQSQPLNATKTPTLCKNSAYTYTSECVACAIQHVGRLLDGFGCSVPVLLFDCRADKRVDGRFEGVGGVGGKDDVFELCAAGELLIWNKYVWNYC
jgi:hypothetical protein